MKKSRRLQAGLLGAALAALLTLGGCGQTEPVPADEPLLPKNDGRPAKLTVAIESPEDIALINTNGALERVMKEIIAKYQADFPDTEIELVYDTRGEKIAAGGGNAPDIELFTGQDPYYKHKEQLPRNTDWLLDLTPYEEAWTDEGTVSNPASLIMRFMGGDNIYALPFSYDQIMLYYRWDWFHEYNLDYMDSEEEKASVNVWNRFLVVGEKLGDKGRLAIDKTVKPYLFDALLWSWVGQRRVADAAFGYYQPDGSTIFTLESAQNAAETYEQVLKLDMGAEDPIGAFIDGEAGMYLGTGMDMVRLSKEMPGKVNEDWYAVGLPKGIGGKTAPLLGWSAWGVNKDSPEPEKAVHFLWYMTNADNNTHMYMELKDYGVKPLYREIEAYEPSLLEGGWYGETDLLNTPSYRYASAPVVFEESTGVNNPVFSSLLSGLESGDITAGEMLEGLDKEYARLLEEYTAGGGKLPWQTDNTEGNP